MTVGIRRLFRRSWSVFWATTYTYDVAAFEEYFLAQLSDRPLNATILADFDRLAESWAGFADPAQVTRLRHVNRNYLVRPVAWRTGVFHPKTYLFANETQGILLVGSGNAGLDGLTRGNEVFSSFRSTDEEGLTATSAWRHWMGELVNALDDFVIQERWHDVLRRLDWLPKAVGPASPSFVTNWETPLIEVLSQMAPAGASELHLMAPFYDPGAVAVRSLIERLRPIAVHVYLGRDMRVQGDRLWMALQQSGTNIHLWQFEPDERVHAKLIGVVAGDDSWLMSGSANLSQAALLGNVWAANVEAGVVIHAPAEAIRAVFRPHGAQIRSLSADSLEKFNLPDDQPGDGCKVRLLRAEILPDATLSLAFVPIPPNNLFVRPAGVAAAPAPLVVRRSESKGVYEEIGIGRTVEAWLSVPSLVELVDNDGRSISNPIPIDDREALAAALREREAGQRKPPSGLTWEDVDTELGRILQELQDSCRFDVAGKRRGEGADAPMIAGGDISFWAREGELDLGTVGGRRSRFLSERLDADELFWKLHKMLLQAPYLPELRPINPRQITETDENEPGKAWSYEARVQLRFFNVLMRWCRSIRDPVMWADEPRIAVQNYIALLAALKDLWYGDGEGRYLSHERLTQLLYTLLESLVGTVDKPGPLATSEIPLRTSLLEFIADRRAPAVAGDLVYDVLRPHASSLLRKVFEWQPILIPALELGVVDSTEPTVRHQLQWVVDYMDEKHWCERIGKQLHLALRFSDVKINPKFDAMLDAHGLHGLLNDPRTVLLLLAYFRFKCGSAVIVSQPETEDRLSVRVGGQVSARIGGQLYRSEDTFSPERLEVLAAEKVGLVALFSTSVAESLAV